MSQEIIVFIILAAVTGYIIFSYLKKLRTKKSSPCDGCSGCDLKKELTCKISEKD